MPNNKAMNIAQTIAHHVAKPNVLHTFEDNSVLQFFKGELVWFPTLAAAEAANAPDYPEKEEEVVIDHRFTDFYRNLRDGGTPHRLSNLPIPVLTTGLAKLINFWTTQEEPDQRNLWHFQGNEFTVLCLERLGIISTVLCNKCGNTCNGDQSGNELHVTETTILVTPYCPTCKAQAQVVPTPLDTEVVVVE